MPLTTSAKKALRVSKRRRVVNLRRLRAMRDVVKRASAETLSAAYAVVDKALKGGVVHRNTAARKKSRLAKKFRTPQL